MQKISCNILFFFFFTLSKPHPIPPPAQNNTKKKKKKHLPIRKTLARALRHWAGGGELHLGNLSKNQD